MLGGRGRPPSSYTSGYKEVTDDKGNNVTFNSDKANRGNDPDYLTARLKRSHGEIYNRWLAGEYRSVRAAAIDAGIVRELTTVEKIKKLWLKMTPEEKEEFQMWATEQL